MNTREKYHWFVLIIMTALVLGALGLGSAQPVQAQAPMRYYVIPSGVGTKDCTSWANACDLQIALTNAVTGDEIWVAAGTYKPAADPAATDPRTATYQLKAGVAVYGGFAGTETSRDERNPQANLTVLSGDLNGDDGENFANNGENSYHVVIGANDAILDGVTITAGNADSGTSSNLYGGGMYNENSSPILSNIIFSKNTATSDGGGMYNENSNPTLANVTFSGNSARYGGGMFNYESSPKLTTVTFISNTVMDNGGGMYNYYSSPILSSVTFSGNSANYGGGMHNSYSDPTMTNVTFSKNTATWDGGGMCNLYSSPTLSSTTFSGNSANSGGGIYNYASSSPVIRNTILWGDMGGELVNSGTSSATIMYSVLQGGCPTGADCTNVIDTDPRLGVLGSYGGATQTIPLLPGSSAIDTGDDSLCPATDQRGVGRPQGAVCDIGAFEYDYTGIYYVAPGGWGTQDGQSWANAIDLQNALKTARSGDEIWVAEGVHRPTTDPDDRTATFQLKEGVAVYGGFVGTETSRDERNPQANLTVLSGDLNGDDGENFANNGENSYHVVTGADGAILDGVTITAGNADYPASSDDLLLRYAGAGMYNKNSNPILSNITFSGNIARAGGGMYNYTSSPTLSNITFSGNSAMYTGGGMFNYDSSNPTLNNITFSGNSAVYDGGGMYNLRSSSPTLTNVTFNGNSANNGGGMYNGTSYPVIRNSILWGNTGGEVICSEPSNATITSSIVQGGCPTGATCTNVIDTDPRLGKLGSYGGSTLTIPLLPGSSAIDEGDDSLCPATDQRGVGRPQGAVCDIGAFESQGFILAISGGDNQMAYPDAAFTSPLEVMVSSAYSEPVDGGTVIFAAPDTGASAAITGSPSTITDGKASVTAVANTELGSYNVIASSSGVASVMFNLANTVLPPTANPGGPYLVAINSAITFDSSGSSDPAGASLTYAWDFGDGSTGTDAMPTHTYTAAGIYDVCLTVNNGALDSEPACTLAVVYDPSAGFVTGGGWIDSQPGAYLPDPSLSGKATFGFVSKYLKGAKVPTGNTEFQFQAGAFKFQSSAYDWLVVSKDQVTAQFKGSGMVNGSLDPNGNVYKFLLWAGDGSPDTFRIKIWWEVDGIENVVYDNGFDQAINGGSIVVHTGK